MESESESNLAELNQLIYAAAKVHVSKCGIKKKSQTHGSWNNAPTWLKYKNNESNFRKLYDNTEL